MILARRRGRGCQYFVFPRIRGLLHVRLASLLYRTRVGPYEGRVFPCMYRLLYARLASLHYNIRVGLNHI